MNNNTVDIKKYAVNFNRARNNLLGVVGLTLLNVLLYIFNIDLYFMFSAITPGAILAFFDGIAIAAGSNILWIIGIILAIAGVGIYFVFYLLSKKYRVFILVAFIFFALDTLMLLLLMVIFFDAGSLIDLAFHGWVWYYLILGTIAWTKLRNVTPAEAQAVLDTVEQETANAEAKSTLETMTSDEAQVNQDDGYEYYGQTDDNDKSE